VTLTLGSTWTRNAGSSLLIDYSSPNSGARSVVTASATTTAALTNGIYGWLLVKDSSGNVGFGTRAAGTNQAITRYDDTTGTTLLVNSNSSTTNFTTLGSTYTGGNGGTLSWTTLTNRSVNSLTIDTTNNFGTIDLGPSTNTLSITAQAILFKGPNDETLTGGKLGAAASEVIIHQTGTGVLTVDSLISATTGSLTVDGTGTTVLNAANAYTGVTSINGGVLSLGSAETAGTSGPLGKQAANAAGTIFFSGGTLQYSAANNFDYSGRFSTAANQQISIDTNGQNVTFATALASSGGSLTKMGNGSLNLSGGNTYTGATNVNAGTLIVSGSLSGTTFVNVSSSATLATGTSGTIATAVGGNVNIAGNLAPGGRTIGSDVGTLNLNLGAGGKLNFAAASSLLFGLGSTSDLVTFNSPGNWLSGSGNATLNLDVTQPGFSYANTYTIFQNVTTTGFAFANITGYDTADWSAHLFQSGSNYQLSFTAVPEPGAVAYLLAGLALMPLLRKRRFLASRGR
jgi:autotransporter-associated beta strand protein